MTDREPLVGRCVESQDGIDLRTTNKQRWATILVYRPLGQQNVSVGTPGRDRSPSRVRFSAVLEEDSSWIEGDLELWSWPRRAGLLSKKKGVISRA